MEEELRSILQDVHKELPMALSERAHLAANDYMISGVLFGVAIATFLVFTWLILRAKAKSDEKDLSGFTAGAWATTLVAIAFFFASAYHVAYSLNIEQNPRGYLIRAVLR